jgi:hypothetical protein
LDDRQKISVVLSSAELERFNSYCDEKGYKKSTLIRRLIRDYLDLEGQPAPDDHGNDTADRQPARAGGTRRGGRARGKGA